MKLVLWATVFALYKEQIGQEVSQKYIGNVIDMHSISAKDIVVLTDTYLTGLRDNTIQWRRVLGNQKGMACSDHCVTFGDQVRSWTVQGSLRWEIDHQASGVAIVDQDLYVVGKELVKVNLENGSILKSWSWEYNDGIPKVYSNNGDLYIKGSSKIWRLHKDELKVIEDTGVLVFSESTAMLVSTNYIRDLVTNKTAMHDNGKVFEVGGDLFYVRGKHTSLVYKVKSIHDVQLVHMLPFHSNHVKYYPVSAQEQAFAFTHVVGGNITTDTVVLGKEKTVFTETETFDLENWGDIQKTWPGLIKRQDSLVPRLYFTTIDGGFHLLGKWSREESLQYAFDAAFVELPTGVTVERDELGVDHSIGMLHRFFLRWYKHSVELMGLNTFEFLKGFVFNGILSSNLASDQHGFRKIVVFATPNKLVAVDTVSGTFVWSKFVQSRLTKLFVTRESRLAVPPLITVVGMDSDKTVLITVDALTGSEYGDATGTTQTTFSNVYQVLETRIIDPISHRKVLAVVSKEVKLYPSSNEINDLYNKIDFYYYLVRSTGLRGYVSKDGKALSLYNVTFPPEETLITFHHDVGGTVASLGRVVGRDVLYKYLNSHIGVFITQRSGAGTTLYVYLIDVVSGTIHSKIVHHGAGNAVKGSPKGTEIHVVKSDNIVVYSFWNHGTSGVDMSLFPPQNETMPDGNKTKKKKVGSASKHQEIVVLELYESAVFNKRFESSVYSAFSSDRFSTIGQSFILSEPVRALGMTKTGNGITSKEVLVGYNLGIQGISRKLLDARRPTGPPTNTDKEDGLIPYHPSILKNPLDVITYYQDIRISQIRTGETGLESTSMVIGFGGDLFITKRTPSGAFDTLSNDFGYLQIIGGLVVLSGALVFVKRAVQQKELKEAWR